MSEKPAQKLSESDDFTDNSVDNAADAAREDTSQQSGLATVESEYDTASDSPSDGEEYDEQEEDESDSGEEEELAESGSEVDDDDDQSDDDVIEVLDYERQSGDGQEQESDAKKKVDDDEDRSNPQYIPKKGTFYEHDDRTVEDDDDGKDADDENAKNDDPAGAGGEGRKGVDKTTASKTMKKWQASADRWTHDRFDESEQAPKSRAELVSAYGYDIRSEDGPPRARRRRRYARGPNKYTRNWEDEDAYSKSNNNAEHNRQRKVLPRPEEFPELGTNAGKPRSGPNSMRRSSKQSRSSIGDRLDERSGGGRPQRLSDRRTGDRRSGGDRGGYDQQQRPMDRERDRGERNWDRERDFEQHDYRDNRTDGSRYSVERVGNNNNSYHNKENKLAGRSSKEKDRRGSDYKVITSLQFKNQTRNKNVEPGMQMAGAGVGPGSAGGQVVHSNSSGALSGSSNTNKMNNSMDRVPQSGPDRMMDPRAVQHHYPPQQAQMIQPQQMAPQQAAQVQQAQQPTPQQIQHHQQQQQAAYDDHYDSYSESKMSKDAKFPYNPPANATIQSVEIGQTDIAKYPPPAATQRTSKDRQQQQQQVLPATAVSGVASMASRSQISPRQIVSTQAPISSSQQLTHQQQQYQQLQQAQQYQQQLHGGPPNATQAPQTQVPPPQLPQSSPAQMAQPPSAAQIHNVHAMGGAGVNQQALLTGDGNSRSTKRYSSLRQRSTLDNPNVVVVQSPLHEQYQQQLHGGPQGATQVPQTQVPPPQLPQSSPAQMAQPPSAAQIQNVHAMQGYPQQPPALPLNLPNEYLVQSASQAGPSVASKPQPSNQTPVQYQHAATGYYAATTPTANEFVTAASASQPVVPVPQQSAVAGVVPGVVNQPQNPLLSAPQYPQYTQHPPIGQYIPQSTATPQPAPQPAAAAPPPQILNYVPSITPAAPTQYPAAPYTGYQNAYTPVVPQPVAPAVPHNPSPSAATAALYQSSGGITYYAPQSQTQAPRPLPSQRRPTSAIPILAPPDRKAKNNRSGGVDQASGGNDGDENNGAPSGAGSAGGNNAADNIDHILDNMFVQRAPYQPPTVRKSPSPAPGAGGSTTTTPAGSGGGGSGSAPGKVGEPGGDTGKELDKESLDKIGDSVKKFTIQEEKLPIVDPMAAGGGEKLDLAQGAPSVDPTAG